MGSKKKTNEGKGIYAVLIVAALAVMLLVGALIAVLVYVLNPLSEDNPQDTQSTQQTTGETGNKNPFFSHEGSESMTVTYNGREVYAGGQVRPEDFTVILNFKDGSSVEITEYESIIQTEIGRAHV